MRSLSQVEVRLETERRERERTIARQTFYCSRRKRITTPGDCHDCFASLPYMERLMRWSESRLQCMAANSSPVQKKKTANPEADEQNESPSGARNRPSADRDRPLRSKVAETDSGYSIQAYMLEALLEFLLEFDSLSERFETWWLNLADVARSRVHRSAELGEMILWFAERLDTFKKSLVLLGRVPEDEANPLKPRRNNVG